MSTNPSVEFTILLIQQLHAGQTDRQGEPYWLHPYRVMRLLPDDASHEARLIALLHDSLEDTDATPAFLEELGYSRHVVDSVALLTRKPGVPYMACIAAIIASGNRDAMMVKLADNRHNTCPTRSTWPGDDGRKARSLADRYAHSMAALRLALA